MSSGLGVVRRVLAVAFGVAGEIVAPTTCAACDLRVPAAHLFCPSCALSVVTHDGDEAAFSYGGAVATALRRLKYEGRHDLGERLGRALSTRRRDVLRRAFDVVVPVPLHPRRLAERGYNQAALLGAAIAGVLDAPLALGAVARVRDTAAQARLPRAARAANVASAFVPRRTDRIGGKRVLLVDDVRTTGATLAACGEALARGGARAVTALVLAARDPESVDA